jgi:hypothetical protein
MKLSSCCLEHLDCLGLRHANRLKNWVGGFKLGLTQFSLTCVILPGQKSCQVDVFCEFFK